jgi:hypothetical protein
MLPGVVGSYLNIQHLRSLKDLRAEFAVAHTRIFIFGRTAAIVRMIFPRSFIVML